MVRVVLVWVMLLATNVCFAADVIRLVDVEKPAQVISDVDKQVEIVKMVESVEKFSIRQLQNQIKSCDDQITNLQTRKAELQAKIDSVKTSLSLTIE